MDASAAEQALLAGDFSRVDPLFDEDEAGSLPVMLRWVLEGRFERGGELEREILTCAAFNGRPGILRAMLKRGVDPNGGARTGLGALHWAANRGHYETVRLLVKRGADLERLNAYGGTVLACALWSAVNEPKPTHLQVVRVLIDAGADLDAVPATTGLSGIDALLRAARQRRR